MKVSGELVHIFIGYLRIVQRTLDYLPLILKGGYVMMVFQRMHLDTGKRWLCRNVLFDVNMCGNEICVFLLV